MILHREEFVDVPSLWTVAASLLVILPRNTDVQMKAFLLFDADFWNL